MKMNKLAVLFLSLSLSLGLTACGGGEEATEVTPEASAPVESTSPETPETSEAPVTSEAPDAAESASPEASEPPEAEASKAPEAAESTAPDAKESKAPAAKESKAPEASKAPAATPAPQASKAPAAKPTPAPSFKPAATPGDVKVTLPANLTGKLSDEDAKGEAAANGYSTYKLNSDGSVTYTMTASARDTRLASLKAASDQMIKDAPSTYKSIKKIEVNSDLSAYTISVDAAAFEGSADMMAALEFMNLGATYQLFNGKQPNSMDVVIKFVDAANGNQLKNMSYAAMNIVSDVKAESPEIIVSEDAKEKAQAAQQAG